MPMDRAHGNGDVGGLGVDGRGTWAMPVEWGRDGRALPAPLGHGPCGKGLGSTLSHTTG